MNDLPAGKLAGKVVCVTGSTQGIGQAIALRLAREGADLVIHGRTLGSSGGQTMEEIQKLGRRVVSVEADLGSVADSRRIIAESIAKLGKIDILVNNAGVERRADFWDVSEEDYEFVMNINVRGTFFVTQAFVNHLRSTQQPGRIINISSVHEELPFPHFSTYCASKGALKMLCRDLAVELAPLGITINNIAPGAITTPINQSLLSNPALVQALIANIPLGKLGTPDDVAGLATFLASDDASYITGATFVVDGGLLWNYQEQ
jgi:glucose 1-dehydrogenase